jgi:octaprenyl-diphosphate synthase
VLLALQDAPQSERDFWKRCMTDLDQKDGDLKEARRLLQIHNSIGKSLDIARDYASGGRQLLHDLPQNDFSAELEALITFAVERDY